MTFLTPVIIVASTGLVAGVILTLASKFLAVPENPLVGEISAQLPGANCGACGFAGCDAYAAALAEDESIKPNLCILGGTEVAMAVCDVQGIPFEEIISKRAVLKCSGTLDKTRYVMDWRSIKSCAANKMFYRGRGACYEACLGYGDCADVCQYDAISIVNGIALVDRERCIGCGMCAAKCPNDLIEIMTGDNNVFVFCSSRDKGSFVRKVCKAGCIACGKCKNVCPADAIQVTDNLAVIDQKKCIQCGACIEVCPVGVIKNLKEV